MPAAGHLAGAIKIELGEQQGISDMMSASIRSLSLNGDQIAAAAGLIAAAPESLILETLASTYVTNGPEWAGGERLVSAVFDQAFSEYSPTGTDHYADLFPLLSEVLSENFGPLLQSLKQLLGPIGRFFKHKESMPEPKQTEQSSKPSSDTTPLP